MTEVSDKYKLNIATWFSARSVAFKPRHFVPTKTPLTTESMLWILETLKGRFSITGNPLTDSMQSGLLLTDELNQAPSFEDPSEAVLYELTWS